MTPTPPPAGKRTGQGREPTTQLPLIRVKRIIKVDHDIQKCGNEAATLITRATESFVQYFAEVAYLFSKIEGRKSIQYVDLSSAVCRNDNLEFLADIVPRTMSYRRAVARKEQMLNSPDSPEHNGSTTTAGRKKSRTSGAGRESAGRGGIERFFGNKGGNGVVEDEVSVQDERMDVDD